MPFVPSACICSDANFFLITVSPPVENALDNNGRDSQQPITTANPSSHGSARVAPGLGKSHYERQLPSLSKCVRVGYKTLRAGASIFGQPTLCRCHSLNRNSTFLSYPASRRGGFGCAPYHIFFKVALQKNCGSDIISRPVFPRE